VGGIGLEPMTPCVFFIVNSKVRVEMKSVFMKAFCVVCKVAREMEVVEQTTMKNGKPLFIGYCPVCGTKMYRLGKSELKT